MNTTLLDIPVDYSGCESEEAKAHGIRLHIDTIGRNNPCPCGSGRKFKKCCLN